MTDSQPLAVGLALAGSGCYAVAVVTQQRVASRLRSEQAFDAGVLAQLIRRPAWLAGLAAVIAGFVLQAVALGLGRLVLVEPVLASGLLFALALAAWRDRRPLRAVEWAAALAAVAGVAVFVGAGQPAGGERTANTAALGITAVAVAALVAACWMLIGRFPAPRRALLLGMAGGMAAGANDAVTKSVAVVVSGHKIAILADPRLYLLVVVGLLTYTIQQNGYRAGALTAFLPAFAVIEAVSGSLLGLVIYEERLSDRPAQIVIEVVASVAAIWGIAKLASPTAAVAAGLPAVPPTPVGQGGQGGGIGPISPIGPIAASSTEEA